MPKNNDLSIELANAVNKKYAKEYGTVAFTDGLINPADIPGYISTGVDVLDLAIANTTGGGLPMGRIIEISGLESSGKSLLAQMVAKNTIDQGGVAVYFDTENAISRDYCAAIGLDINKMVYLSMYEIESIFDTIVDMISRIREKNKKTPVTIIVDSIMGATTKDELQGSFERGGYATTKSIVLSLAMRKITGLIAKEQICLILINQLRENLGATFGEKYKTSGGKAVPFHSSVRLRVKSVGQKKIGDVVVGIRTEVKVIKNRLGPPQKKVLYDIYFDSGVDNIGSWLEVLKRENIVKQSGAWYSYDFNSQVIKFQSKDLAAKLSEVKGLREDMYAKICDACLSTYKVNEDFGSDDVEIDNNVESENE